MTAGGGPAAAADLGCGDGSPLGSRSGPKGHVERTFPHDTCLRISASEVSFLWESSLGGQGPIPIPPAALGGVGGWHRAMVLVSLPLVAPIGLSPLHILHVGGGGIFCPQRFVICQPLLRGRGGAGGVELTERLSDE